MIDYELLVIAMKDSILEDDWDKYDFESIAKNSTPCWDDTAVMCRANDFQMIIDAISYDVLDISTNDAGGE